jgi:hypothetical protein
LLLFTLFVPFAYSRYRQGLKPGFFRAASRGLVFLFISLLIFSPWMARNYHWKNNPIYPFYDSVFNPPELSAQDSGVFQNQKYRPGIFTMREVLYGETWWEMSLLPIRVFFQGKDGDPKYFDGKLSPFLLIFPFFAFLRSIGDSARLKAEKAIFAAFAFFYFFLALFSSDLRIRYIAPFIPSLVILSIFGVHRIREMLNQSEFLQSKTMKTLAFLTVVSFPLFYNAAYIYGQFKVVAPFSYLSGSVSRDEYVARFRPEHPAILYINNHLPEDALISLVFLGNRGYYLDREYIYGEDELLRIGKKSDTPEDILAELRALEITHLFIYEPLFGRWISDNLGERVEESLKLFFLNYAKLVYSRNGFTVLAL